MDNFFDNLCRTLATPMPRSRALKIIAGGLAGSLLAPFAFGQGQGNKPVDPNTPGGGGGKQKCTGSCVCSGAQQGGGCCSPGQTCFGNQICCSAGYVGMSVLKQNKTQITCVQFNASGTYPGNSTLLGQGNTCS